MPIDKLSFQEFFLKIKGRTLFMEQIYGKFDSRNFHHFYNSCIKRLSLISAT